jgi:hypothetical protein
VDAVCSLEPARIQDAICPLIPPEHRCRLNRPQGGSPFSTTQRRALLPIRPEISRFVQPTCGASRDWAPIHPNYARFVTLSAEGVERLHEKSKKRQEQFFGLGGRRCHSSICDAKSRRDGMGRLDPKKLPSFHP